MISADSVPLDSGYLPATRSVMETKTDDYASDVGWISGHLRQDALRDGLTALLISCV